MVSGTHAAHDIEVTAESLQAELERLQIQKQALERELAAVVAHLGSVQRALSTLETLMLTPAGEARPAVGTAAAEPAEAAAPVTRQTRAASPEPADATVTSGGVAQAQPTKPGKGTQRHTAVGADTDGQKKYGMLTEQIMEYFAAAGDADVRARDVAAALGRDSDSGSINAVRSTLDRLVGASRIRRTGRGLYRAKRSAS
ncbi:hypothetical protein ACIBJF_47460 [Streptomyces sp. NPDC050743]|uniref:hypothetical protein n=1 Tax=Streptomyces sp. NPDC050743 TaxID=3365634 RepID=UPI0037954A52